MDNAEATFIERNNCINCDSTRLTELSGGLFSEEPLRSFIENDPWGQNPMPFIANQRWSFVQCDDCRQKFHRNVLSEEWNNVRFSQWMTEEAIRTFEESDENLSDHFGTAKSNAAHAVCIENATRQLRGDDPVRVLDFGCGWGEFLSMCDLFGFVGCGIDRSSHRRQCGQNVTILPSIEELKNNPDTPDSFHVITLFQVIEHLDDPLEILQALSELVVKDGLLIMEAPDCENVTQITDMTSYRLMHPLDHINTFTQESMQSIARRAGFVPFKPCVSHVTDSSFKAVKNEIKHRLYGMRHIGTNQYFRKL